LIRKTKKIKETKSKSKELQLSKYKSSHEKRIKYNQHLKENLNPNTIIIHNEITTNQNIKNKAPGTDESTLSSINQNKFESQINNILNLDFNAENYNIISASPINSCTTKSKADLFEIIIQRKIDQNFHLDNCLLNQIDDSFKNEDKWVSAVKTKEIINNDENQALKNNLTEVKMEKKTKKKTFHCNCKVNLDSNDYNKKTKISKFKSK